MFSRSAMHPVHFWFIHDLRAYKKAMIALAEKAALAALASKSPDDTIGGYRPDVEEDSINDEFYDIANTYLKASGYYWPFNDAPSKLYILQRQSWKRLKQRDVHRVQKIPDFAFRLPPAIRSTLGSWEKPFEVILIVVFSPILAVMFAGAMCLKGVELSFGYMGKFLNWGLTKILPENLPESRVLGTETTQKKLPAQTTQ